MSKKKWVNQTAADVMTISGSIWNDNTRTVANAVNYNAQILKDALNRIVELEKAIKLKTESESYACIEENREHEIAELICLKCFSRAIHVYPEKTLLKELECKCGEIGYLIKTGQTLPDIDVEKFEHDARYRNMVKMWGKKEAIEKYKTFVLGQE